MVSGRDYLGVTDMTEQEKQFFDLLAQSMATAAHKGEADVLDGLLQHGTKAMQDLKARQAEQKSRLHSERVKVGIEAARRNKEQA